MRKAKGKAIATVESVLEDSEGGRERKGYRDRGEREIERNEKKEGEWDGEQ